MGQLVFVPNAGGGGGGGTVQAFRQPFVDADLAGGVLTVVHLLGVRYNAIFVYDNNEVEIDPDSITDVDASTVDIDLSSFQVLGGGTIAGTWNVVVIG
jgi:hypothetical protein